MLSPWSSSLLLLLLLCLLRFFLGGLGLLNGLLAFLCCLLRLGGVDSVCSIVGYSLLLSLLLSVSLSLSSLSLLLLL